MRFVPGPERIIYLSPSLRKRINKYTAHGLVKPVYDDRVIRPVRPRAESLEYV